MRLRTFEMFMTSVTKGGSGSGFASAKGNALLFGKDHNFREHAGLFVIAVTERLLFRFPAGTPGIPASFSFDSVGTVMVFFGHNIYIKYF